MANSWNLIVDLKISGCAWSSLKKEFMNSAIFCMLKQIKENLSYFNNFWVGMVKNRRGLFELRDSKIYLILRMN